MSNVKPCCGFVDCWQIKTAANHQCLECVRSHLVFAATHLRSITMGTMGSMGLWASPNCHQAEWSKPLMPMGRHSNLHAGPPVCRSDVWSTEVRISFGFLGPFGNWLDSLQSHAACKQLWNSWDMVMVDMLPSVLKCSKVCVVCDSKRRYWFCFWFGPGLASIIEPPLPTANLFQHGILSPWSCESCDCRQIGKISKMLSKFEKLWLLSQNLRITIGPWRTGYEALESWRCASDYYHLSSSVSYRSICYESIVYIQEHAAYMIWIHFLCIHVSYLMKSGSPGAERHESGRCSGQRWSIFNT